jgi:hypothetical protein
MLRSAAAKYTTLALHKLQGERQRKLLLAFDKIKEKQGITKLFGELFSLILRKVALVGI